MVKTPYILTSKELMKMCLYGGEAEEGEQHQLPDVEIHHLSSKTSASMGVFFLNIGKPANIDSSPTDSGESYWSAAELCTRPV